MALEAEPVLERPEDRLDPLADHREVNRALRLTLAIGPQDLRCEAILDLGGELPTRVALVADDLLAAAKCLGQEAQGDLALGLIGRGEDRCPRGAVGGAAQMQAHAPKPARVRAAVAIATGVGQL